MSIKTVREIVDILIQDIAFIKKYKELCHLLELPADIIAPLELEYNRTTLPIKDIFMKILEAWISINDIPTAENLCEILRNLDSSQLAEEIEDSIAYNERPVTIQLTRAVARLITPFRLPVSFGIPKLVENYVPRPTEERKLLEYYKISQKTEITADKNRQVCVNGFAGTGKTELVKRFLENPELRSLSKIWLPSDSVAVLKQAIINLAITFNILSTHNHSPSIDWLFGKICYLLANSTCIFVFDSVEKDFEELLKVRKMSQCLQSSFIVVTTGRVNQFCGTMQLLSVKGFEKQQALAFVKNNLIDTSTVDKKVEFCNRLDNLPLALQMAVTYIEQERVTFEHLNFGIFQFLDNFTPKSAKSGKMSELGSTISQVVSDIMRKLGSQSNGKIILRIMQIVSILYPCNVNLSFLKRMCLLDNDKLTETELSDAIFCLEKYNLITVDTMQKTFSVHRRTQKMSAAYFNKLDRPGILVSRRLTHDKSYFSLAIRLLDIFPDKNLHSQFDNDSLQIDYLYRTCNFFSYTKCRFQLPAIFVLTSLVLLIVLASQFQRFTFHRETLKYINVVVFLIYLVIHIFLISKHTRLYGSAVFTAAAHLERSEQYSEAHDCYKSFAYIIHPRNEISFFLGLNLLRMGMHIKAKKLLKHSLGKKTKRLGLDNAEVIVNKVCLAEAYSQMGSLIKAKELLQDVLSNRDSHPTVDFVFVDNLLHDLSISTCTKSDGLVNFGEFDRKLSFWESHRHRVMSILFLISYSVSLVLLIPLPILVSNNLYSGENH